MRAFPALLPREVAVSAILDTPTDQNPNAMSDEDFRGLVEAVRHLDFAQAVTLDELPSGEFRIVDGQHRKRAAALVGRETLPALVYKGLDEAQFRSLRLALNRWRGDLRPHVVQEDVLLLHEAGLQREHLFAACGLTHEELDAILLPPPAESLGAGDDLRLPDPEEAPRSAPPAAEGAACSITIPCSSPQARKELTSLLTRACKAAGARGKFKLEAALRAALRAYVAE
ncbi:MAG: hypothetical protein E6Q97_20245 [Desulfurellales bacterium]|nr:MAG: hypothetical protein E6Q97_20245 [Desulfurellales bacterium]